MDNFLGIDPAILSAYNQGPSDEERKRAMMQGILAAGLGMMQNANMKPLQALGYGGLLGVQAKNQTLDEYAKQKQQNLAGMGQALQLQNMIDQRQQAIGARNVINDLQNPPPVSMGPPAPDGSMSQEPAPQALPQGMTRRDLAARYQAYGAALAQKGYAEQAKSYFDQAEKLQPKLKDTKTLTQDGQRVTVNIYDDGTTQVLPLGPDQEKAHFIDTGTKVGAVDPFTGRPIPGGGLYNKEQTPDSRASTAASYAHLAETKRHNEIIEGDPATIEATAQGIANGNLAPLSGFALGRPMGQAVMARVMQINPNYSGKDFSVGMAAEKKFNAGKLGDTVRSFNVGLAHLDTLDQATTALNNGNIPLFNRAANAIATQTGNPAPGNFEAVKEIVGNEIVKAIVGSGGGVGDREKAQKSIDAAKSPGQLRGVIATYKSLMQGQLGGLKREYESSTGKRDFEKFLSPEAKITAHAPGTDVRSQADKILQGL